jgi:hypothetical protein
MLYATTPRQSQASERWRRAEKWMYRIDSVRMMYPCSSHPLPLMPPAILALLPSGFFNGPTHRSVTATAPFVKLWDKLSMLQLATTSLIDKPGTASFTCFPVLAFIAPGL